MMTQFAEIVSYRRNDDLVILSPKPQPVTTIQFPVFRDASQILDAHLRRRGRDPSIFSNGNTFICYDPNDLNARVAPDYYMAFGVDADAIMQRGVYLPWEAGKPPDLVLEVGSPTTARIDLTDKQDLYARIGVTEYRRFDPTGGDHYGAPQAGGTLVEGEYSPFPIETLENGIVRGFSPLLELSLCWVEGEFRGFDHELGEYIDTLYETRLRLDRLEAENVRMAEENRRLRALLDRSDDGANGSPS